MSQLHLLSERELAKFMLGLIGKSEVLIKDITAYLDRPNPSKTQHIEELYKEFRNELKATAKYVNKLNIDKGNELYENYFCPSISEADNSGVNVPANPKVNYDMLVAVTDTHNSLTYYMIKDEWVGIAKADKPVK